MKKKTIIGLVITLGMLPCAALAQVPAPETNLGSVRTMLIESYLSGLMPCADASSSACADSATSTAMQLQPSLQDPVSFVCGEAPSALCQFASVIRQQQELYPALPTAQGGNGLFDHLDTLFALDALFRNASDGLLSPQSTTLGDLIILYQLFFAPTPSA